MRPPRPIARDRRCSAKQTASKQPVKNVDLWQQLDALVSQHEIEWRWVRGHTGHPENELADQLANLGVEHVLKERKG